MAADPTLQARMMQEMSDKYKEFTKNLPANKDPSKMSPQQMEQMGRAMSSARDLKAMIHPTLPTSFLCRGHLKNGDKVVLETTLNGKELFPENTAIQEAMLTLKIEHAGNVTPRK